MTIRWPDADRLYAMAWPIPEPAPVMTAVFMMPFLAETYRFGKTCSRFVPNKTCFYFAQPNKLLNSHPTISFPMSNRNLIRIELNLQCPRPPSL